MIPSDESRPGSLPHDEHPYEERRSVERFFAEPEHSRRVATRRERAARDCLAVGTPACAVNRLR